MVSDLVMEKFLDLAYRLSPENLTWDGERDDADMRHEEKLLKSKWRSLEKSIGRTMTEGEVYAWDTKRQIRSR